MRLPILGLFLAVASSAYSQRFYTLTFTNQDFHPKEWITIEKFGLTEKQIVKMGHDRFVEWYCDDSRATKEGRITAEKVFGLAYSESNAPLLKAMPRADQYFIETAISGFADMAKSSWSMGIECTSQHLRWDLPAAQMVSSVPELVYALLTPSVPTPAEVDLKPLLSQVTERLKKKDPTVTSTRLDFTSDYLEKMYKDRPVRERRLVRAFTANMLKIALLTPEPK